MKTLVVFYSRSGVTRLVAQAIASATGADIEEIRCLEAHEGPVGYGRSLYEVAFTRLPRIGELRLDPADYDRVVVGSPVWAGRLASPVTTFLKKHQSSIRSLASFITHGDPKKSYADVFEFVERAAGQKCAPTLSVPSSVVKRVNYYEVMQFANVLNRP